MCPLFDDDCCDVDAPSWATVPRKTEPAGELRDNKTKAIELAYQGNTVVFATDFGTGIDSIPPEVHQRLVLWTLKVESILNRFHPVSAGSGACNELRERVAPGHEPHVLHIPATMILAMDPLAHMGGATLLAELIGRAKSVIPGVIVSVCAADIGRLKDIPHTLVTAFKPTCSPWLRRMGSATLPFAGRSKDLRRLRRLLQEASNVVLTGPPGCGKTHLARALAADNAMRTWACYELSPQELSADASTRGTLESRIVRTIAFMRSQGPEALLYVDEGVLCTERCSTGPSEHARDSILDLLLSQLTQRNEFLVMIAAIDTDLPMLWAHSRALQRRFEELALGPLDRESLQEIVVAWSQHLGLHVDAFMREQIIRAARISRPGLPSPAREVDIVQRLARDKMTSPLDLVRLQLGELSAPRLDRLLDLLRPLERSVPGRVHELSVLQNAFRRAIGRLLAGDLDSNLPFCVVALAGCEGSGKTFFAAKVAGQLARSVHEIDATELPTFVRLHRDQPGLGLLVHAELGAVSARPGGATPADQDARAGGMSLSGALAMLRELPRALVFLILQTDASHGRTEPVLLTSPYVVQWLPVEPVRLNDEQRRAVASDLWDRLRERAESLGVGGIDRGKELVELAVSSCNSPSKLERFLIAQLTGPASSGRREDVDQRGVLLKVNFATGTRLDEPPTGHRTGDER